MFGLIGHYAQLSMHTTTFSIAAFSDASSNSENSIKDILKSCQVLYCEPKPNTSSNWKANSGGILVYNGSASSTATIKKIMQAISSSVL